MLGHFGDLGLGTMTGQIFGYLRERNVDSPKTTLGCAQKREQRTEILFQCPSPAACVEGGVASMAEPRAALS